MSPVAEDKLRLGGMALRNGLLVHGPTNWAASVRDDAGEIRTASGRKPTRSNRPATRSRRSAGVPILCTISGSPTISPAVMRGFSEA